MPEPQMPSFNEEIKDPIGDDNAGGEKKESESNNDSAGTDKDEKSKSDASKSDEGGTPKDDERFTKLTEGWREDLLENEKLRNENRIMKDKLSKTKNEDEDEEYEGLSDEERINKKMAKRETESKARQEEELEAVKRDIRFHERTDPVFKAHKQEILAIAEQINAKNVEQAIKVYLKIVQTAKEKAKGTTPVEKPKPKTAPKKTYDKKEDENKSFGDMFREGGVS